MAVIVLVSILIAAVVPLAVLFLVANQVTQSNTRELARDKAAIVVQSIEGYVTQYLDAVPPQAAQLGKLVGDGEAALRQPDATARLFSAAMAATPQVTTLSLATFEGRVLRVFRNRPDRAVRLDDWSDDHAFLAKIEAYRDAPAGRWAGLFFAESVRRPFLNYIVPLPGPAPDGVIIASVSLAEMSRYLGSLEGHLLGTPFILRGADAVLAHPRLPEIFDTLSDDAPLPAIADVPDAALPSIWSERRARKLEARLANSVESRVVEVDGAREAFLFRALDDYDDEAWLVGVHLPMSVIAPQLDRLKLLVIAGVAAIVAALAISLLLTRSLTAPMQRLAHAADRLRRLDFEGARPADSAYREVNEVTDILEQTRLSLRAFSRYVPRDLVRRLLHADAGARFPGTLAEVTVLFTDISGFSALSEDLSATQIAQMLNHHFAMLDRCVNAADGTTDKYIGDSLMAFWGAPDQVDDHADRACRAALDIARAVADDNDRRRTVGEPPIRVRIGIHSGPVVVGDIGSEDRVNYTVVGDTVNVAERLCELARQVPEADGDVVCLISRQTARQAGGAIRLRSLGSNPLHGRQGPVEALVLDLGDASSDAA